VELRPHPRPRSESVVRPFYEDIDQVEVVDTYTLRVRMKEPSGALPMALAGYFQGIPMVSPQRSRSTARTGNAIPLGRAPL